MVIKWCIAFDREKCYLWVTKLGVPFLLSHCKNILTQSNILNANERDPNVIGRLNREILE